MFWPNSAPPPPPDDLNAPRKPTRDEEADAELAALLAALDEEHAAASAKNSKPAAATFRDASERKSFAADYPDTMNCRTCFDEMFYCYSLGGQFMNVYRYGTMRDCSQKSADWRFCMRTKVHGPVAKKAMIQARNREKAAKFEKLPNSEDVWSTRTEPLKNPFSGKAEDLMEDNIS